MKTTILITALSVLTILMVQSCAQEKSNETIPETSQEKDLVEEEITTLELNEGNKWDVPEQMEIHIDHVDSLLSHFQDSSDMNFPLLAAQLQDELKDLANACSMTGVSHEMLHLWLLPFWDQVDALQNSQDSSQQLEVLDSLKAGMNTYKFYFE